jgi:hypothetical protein
METFMSDFIVVSICRRRCGVFKPFFDRRQTRRKRLQNKYHNKTVSITPPFLLGYTMLGAKYVQVMTVSRHWKAFLCVYV